METHGGRPYSSIILNLGNTWPVSRPGRFTPGVQLIRGGWAPQPVWTRRRTEKESLFLAGNRIPAVQLVARRYTD
jgi:hypothetical protein